jgi:hypothetical protein
MLKCAFAWKTTFVKHSGAPEQSDKEEVTIKRMIGLKKDEYFVDGKHVS